jgi:thiol-disulfide isomerase/thioredoxin
MKFVALIFFICLSFLNPWDTTFSEATDKAKKENKLILLNFSGSDWCGPCIKLKKEVFESATFTAFAEKNLILVRADFPRKKANQLTEALRTQNEQLAEKYNSKGKFPLTVLLTADGKVLKEWDGYPKNLDAEKLSAEIALLRK